MVSVTSNIFNKITIIVNILLNNLTYLFLLVDDDTCNNPNLHLEEQDELEIPDGKDL